MIERIILHSKTQISLNERFQRLQTERSDKRRGLGRRGGNITRIQNDALSGTMRGRIDKRRGGRNDIFPVNNNATNRIVTVDNVVTSPSSYNRGPYRGSYAGGSRRGGRGYGRPIQLDGGALLFVPRGGSSSGGNGGGRQPRYSQQRGKLLSDESPIVPERQVIIENNTSRGRGGYGVRRSYRGMRGRGGLYRGR